MHDDEVAHDIYTPDGVAAHCGCLGQPEQPDEPELTTSQLLISRTVYLFFCRRSLGAMVQHILPQRPHHCSLRDPCAHPLIPWST